MRAAAALCAFALGGCSTATRISDQQGQPVVMIECGSATSFSVCYKRAEKECPSGYRMVSEEPGFNRKTLKVECKQ